MYALYKPKHSSAWIWENFMSHNFIHPLQRMKVSWQRRFHLGQKCKTEKVLFSSFIYVCHLSWCDYNLSLPTESRSYQQSSKWKFEFTDPKQILEFISIKFLKKMTNLLVRTKFYWSWAGGPVLILRTVSMKSQ